MSVKLVYPSLVIFAILLVSGCSHSGTGPFAGGGSSASAGKSGPPSATVIQSQIAKVQADQSIPANQKAMILGQMRRAIAMQRPRPAAPPKASKVHP